MPKKIPHRHEVKRLPDNSGVYDVYLPAASEICSPFLISSGLLGQPRDYFGLARELARSGIPAIVPNTNIPLVGESSKDPMVYRPNVLEAVMDNEAQRWDRFNLAGHSFGGAYQLGVVETLSGKVDSVNFINAVGFEKFRDFVRLARFLKDEAPGVLPHILFDMVKHPSSIPGRIHLSQRARDVMAILSLEEGHNLPFIEAAMNAGIACRALVDVDDHLVSAEETHRVAAPVMGEDNVIFVHEASGHLSIKSKPRVVAKKLLDTSVSISAAA